MGSGSSSAVRHTKKPYGDSWQVAPKERNSGGTDPSDYAEEGSSQQRSPQLLKNPPTAAPADGTPAAVAPIESYECSATSPARLSADAAGVMNANPSSDALTKQKSVDQASFKSKGGDRDTIISVATSGVQDPPARSKTMTPQMRDTMKLDSLSTRTNASPQTTPEESPSVAMTARLVNLNNVILQGLMPYGITSLDDLRMLSTMTLHAPPSTPRNPNQDASGSGNGGGGGVVPPLQTNTVSALSPIRSRPASKDSRGVKVAPSTAPVKSPLNPAAGPTDAQQSLAGSTTRKSLIADGHSSPSAFGKSATRANVDSPRGYLSPSVSRNGDGTSPASKGRHSRTSAYFDVVRTSLPDSEGCPLPKPLEKQSITTLSEYAITRCAIYERMFGVVWKVLQDYDGNNIALYNEEDGSQPTPTEYAKSSNEHHASVNEAYAPTIASPVTGDMDAILSGFLTNDFYIHALDQNSGRSPPTSGELPADSRESNNDWVVAPGHYVFPDSSSTSTSAVGLSALQQNDEHSVRKSLSGRSSGIRQQHAGFNGSTISAEGKKEWSSLPPRPTSVGPAMKADGSMSTSGNGGSKLNESVGPSQKSLAKKGGTVYLIRNHRSISQSTLFIPKAASMNEEEERIVVETAKAVISRKENGKTINQYLIVKQLGQGSFGKVFLAKNTQNGSMVAIKAIQFGGFHKKNREQRQKMIHREIAVMKSVKHPNTVQLYEVIGDDEADTLYMVMQYVPKGTVSPKAGPTTVVPIAEPLLRKYAVQLLSALQWLHRRTIFHRDIKPDNILLGNDGRVFLGDFGVSVVCSEDGVEGVEGTPAFLAPELCRGDREVHGDLVDVWALGVTFYQLAYGVLPFQGYTYLQLTRHIINDPLQFPDDLEADNSPEAKEMLAVLADEEAHPEDREVFLAATKIHMSNDFKEMIRGMLEKDQDKRLSSHAAMKCKWIKDEPYVPQADVTAEEECSEHMQKVQKNQNNNVIVPVDRNMSTMVAMLSADSGTEGDANGYLLDDLGDSDDDMESVVVWEPTKGMMSTRQSFASNNFGSSFRMRVGAMKQHQNISASKRLKRRNSSNHSRLGSLVALLSTNGGEGSITAISASSFGRSKIRPERSSAAAPKVKSSSSSTWYTLGNSMGASNRLSEYDVSSPSGQNQMWPFPGSRPSDVRASGNGALPTYGKTSTTQNPGYPPKAPVQRTLDQRKLDGIDISAAIFHAAKNSAADNITIEGNSISISDGSWMSARLDSNGMLPPNQVASSAPSAQDDHSGKQTSSNSSTGTKKGPADDVTRHPGMSVAPPKAPPPAKCAPLRQVDLDEFKKNRTVAGDAEYECDSETPSDVPHPLMKTAEPEFDGDGSLGSVARRVIVIRRPFQKSPLAEAPPAQSNSPTIPSTFTDEEANIAVVPGSEVSPRTPSVPLTYLDKGKVRPQRQRPK